MKRFATKVLPGTMMAGLLMVTAMAWSGGHKGGGGHDPERMLAHMTEQLNLSDTQQVEIEAILSSGKVTMETDANRLSEIRSALGTQNSNFNEAETVALTDELGQITARLSYQKISTRAAVYEVLDEEQREEMDALQESRKGQRKSKRQKPDE